MFTTLHEHSIRQLIRLLRYIDIPEHKLLSVIHHSLLVFHCMLNAGIAAVCGYITAFYLREDNFLAFKISACMISLGYRVHIIRNPTPAGLIATLLRRDPI